LGALLERAGTGRGKLVEVSMLEAMAHFAVEPFAAFFALGTVPKSSDRPRLAQAYILRTADDKLIAIHLSSREKFWLGLVTALDAGELARDPRFAERLSRIANYEALGAELDRRFRLHPQSEWCRRLNDHDVPFAPINGIDAVVEDPQVDHLGLIVPVNGAQQGGSQAVRPPLQFDGERAREVTAAPLLDQHGAAIRAAVNGGRQWPAT
jgi:crotonobetainyl-CoA:carnitine CoA-transferase CaiB-like acyl-CoA transferase